MPNFYQFRLTAGKDYQAPVRGKLILVDDIGVASGVDITPMRENAEGRTMPARKKAFKCWTDYDAVVLRSDVDTTVSLFLSDTDVNLGFADGAAVNVSSGQIQVTNDTSHRVPVEIGGSTVTVTADNVGVNNSEANPVPMRPVRQTVIVDAGATAVGLASVIAVSDPTLRIVRFRNPHASAKVALGGAGVTLANAVIVLEPGDMWNETDAPGAEWHAISDTAGASVLVQGLK